MEINELHRPIFVNPWEQPTPPIPTTPPQPPLTPPIPLNPPTPPAKEPPLPTPSNFSFPPIQPPKPLMHIPLAVFVMMFVLVLAALGLIFVNNWVQPSNPREITVQGTGIAYLAPDVAKIDFGVRSESRNLADSQRDNAAAIAKIKNDLTAFAIAGEDIQTINYNITPDYLYSGTQKPRLTGYTTYHFLRLTIRKLDQVDAILQTLGYSGATDISQISFTIDDKAEVKSEAREKAIADAKNLAQQTANLSGVKLGKIISIQEDTSSTDSNPSFVDGMGGGGSPGVEQGSLSVTSTVTITYSLK